MAGDKVLGGDDGFLVGDKGRMLNPPPLEPAMRETIVTDPTDP